MSEQNPESDLNRRSLEFSTFEAVLEDIDGLHLNGYVPLGEWNLAQILEHLRLTMESAYIKKDLGIPHFLRWILKKLFLGQILSKRRMKAGLRTAKGLMPKDVDQTTESEEVRLFKETVQKFVSHTGEYVRNPAFGALSRDEWQLLQRIHCGHHLSFLVPKGGDSKTTGNKVAALCDVRVKERVSP